MNMSFEVYFNALNSLIKFKLKKIRPFNAILLLTYECNENCRFCYNKLKEKELSTLEWKKVIKEIRKNIKNILSSQPARIFREKIRPNCEGCLFNCSIEVSRFFSTPTFCLIKQMPLYMKDNYIG
jgi:biotin synthase-like enzyme